MDTKEIEKLHSLKEKGIITEKEYNDKVQELMEQTTAPAQGNYAIPAYKIWAVIVLILSLTAAYFIFIGGHKIGNISSVGGRTLEEAYYHHLGVVYQGCAVLVAAMGIFFSAVLYRLQK